jgi:DUF2934 family protein
MTEKRVVKVTKRKPRKAVMSDVADSVAMGDLETSTPNPNGAAAIDPEMRRRLVAAEAYFFAERRGFSAGGEVEDWVAAERVVDSWLNRSLNS